MIKRFKNGNMNCRFDSDEYDEREGALINLLYELFDKDCDILGEEFCLNNYEMGLYVYSYYTDKKYLINYSWLDDWLDGKVIKLRAEDLDEDDREILREQDDEEDAC